MPVMVEMRQRGGIDLISYKCLATLSVVGVSIDGMSMSRTRASSRGFEAITFILSRLQMETRIFFSASAVA